MKYFKVIYKSKNNHETRLIKDCDFGSVKYNHKTKYFDFEVNKNPEGGFIKDFKLSSLEIFLTSPNGGIFTLEVFETEEETC